MLSRGQYPIPAAFLAFFLVSGCSGGGGGAGGVATPAALVNPASAATVVLLDLTSLSSLTPLPAGPSTAVVVANSGASFFPVRVSPAVEARTGIGGIEEFTLRIPELAVNDAFGTQDINHVPDHLFQSVSWAVGTKPLGNGGEIRLYLLNPDEQFLRYDTFGVWSVATGSSVSSLTAGALSLGAATPANQVPTTGLANYDGIMNAFLVRAPADADVTAAASATVDFSRRQIDFRTHSTVSQNLTTRIVSPAPGLDMSGTLTYPGGTNSASGTLRTADGMSGPTTARFVGPAAAELGGTFQLADPADTQRLIGGFSMRAP